MAEFCILLFLMVFYPQRRRSESGFYRVESLIKLDISAHNTKIAHNNTPPASLLAPGRECSAPRGVTRFWGAEK